MAAICRRAVGPYFFSPDDSLFFHSFNRNKKSLALDLGCDTGQAVFHDLVQTADAVASNLRGDVPEKLALTYEHLKHKNPQIVCAHLSAYGRTGPRATWPGFDYLMQAEAGYFSLTGEPDTPPARFGLSVVDLMTGLGLAYALLAALTSARATGEGRDIDVSLFDVALNNLGYLATWYLNKGVAQTRLPRSAHPSLTPCQLYRTQDGWIYIMCNKEKFWPILCEAIEKPEWIDDTRFPTICRSIEVSRPHHQAARRGAHHPRHRNLADNLCRSGSRPPRSTMSPALSTINLLPSTAVCNPSSTRSMASIAWWLRR